jgi:hypothetical protein
VTVRLCRRHSGEVGDETTFAAVFEVIDRRVRTATFFHDRADAVAALDTDEIRRS